MTRRRHRAPTGRVRVRVQIGGGEEQTKMLQEGLQEDFHQREEEFITKRVGPPAGEPSAPAAGTDEEPALPTTTF